MLNLASFQALGFLGGSMSGGEILLIMLAMLLLFGSKKLPSMARNLGKSIETFRRASREMTDEIMRADFHDDAAKSTAKNPKPGESSTGGTSPEEIAVKPSSHTVGRNESHPS